MSLSGIKVTLMSDCRSMKGEIEQISAKIQTLEVNQETSHKENLATHTRLDDMAVKVKEIRLLTGVR